MKLGDSFHLTYCSNIHPGETWDEVRDNLARYLPAVRDKLGVAGSFGIGLRLSAQAAEALEEPPALASFQEFLRRNDFYVFTLNGFPYGVFHRARVKEEVYLPDWLDEERLRYTDRLARLLAALLPDETGLEGSISTVPGAFKARVRSRDDVRAMALRMLRHAAQLRALRERTGKTIALALEPEPCCHLETVDETIAFFRDHLLDPELHFRAGREGGRVLQEADVRRHIGLCFDACHMAVEFEDPSDALARIGAAGIRICKFQITSAVRVRFRSGERGATALEPLAESVYLHQVVERSDEGVVRYTDLPEGLRAESAATARDGDKEWRVHFHVPVFLEEMTSLGTTQDYLSQLLERIRRDPPCRYLEVETYTWDVLPPEYRTVDTATAVARELAWVRERLVS